MNKNRLTRTQVCELISNYKSQVWDKRGIFPDGQGDASSAWLDLQAIKEFVNEIETHNVSKAIDENDRISGIRFYYGAYPEGFGNVPPGYVNRHTLVMVPTFKQKEGIANYDDEGNEVGWGRIDAMNWMHLCPPNCGGGGGFGNVIAQSVYASEPKVQEVI